MEAKDAANHDGDDHHFCLCVIAEHRQAFNVGKLTAPFLFGAFEIPNPAKPELTIEY